MIKAWYGDSTRILKRLACDGVRVGAVITDPPYYLDSIVKRFGSKTAMRAKDPTYDRISKRFIGETWDSSNAYQIANDVNFWELVKDVMLPGAYILSFASPRTGHRQICAIEDAGFEVHPFNAWVYATGMPKGKSAEKLTGDGSFAGRYYGQQSVKPSLEPIYMAQKPIEGSYRGNLQKYGVGSFGIDDCRYDGRWPSSLIHDGEASFKNSDLFAQEAFSDQDRLFYSGKAGKYDRGLTGHPTVKPINLLRRLVRLVSRKGDMVLDPFAGSGTTGIACALEDRNSILIEKEPHYYKAMLEHLSNVLNELP